jgi:hypothetical protein
MRSVTKARFIAAGRMRQVRRKPSTSRFLLLIGSALSERYWMNLQTWYDLEVEKGRWELGCDAK